MLVFLVLFTFACLIVFAFIETRHRRFARMSQGIPVQQGYLPITGHGHKLLKTDGEYLWNVFVDISRQAMSLGGISMIWLGPVPCCVISEPKDVLYLSNACLDKPYFYGFAKRWLGDGLVTTLNASSWKRHRKIVIPAFNYKCLDGFMGVFNQQAALLVQDLTDKVGAGEFEHTDKLTRRTLETVCWTTLGLASEDFHLIGDDYEFACDNMSEILANRLATIWNHPNCLYKYSKIYREETKMLDIIHTLSDKVIQKTKAETKPENMFAKKSTGGKSFNAIINMLMDNTEVCLSDREIRNHINTFIMAGFDTTSRSLSAVLITIGSYKDVQNKLYEEIKEVFGDSKRDVTNNDLQKLVYLDAVLKESLRLYPLVPIIARQAPCDTRVRNHIIPSGTAIVCSLWAMNRSACWGPDAEEFRPERWLEAGKLPDIGLATFSVGKRNCIGKYYAQMLLKTNLVHLLREYRFTGDHTKIKFKCEVVMRIVKGNSISIDKR